MSYKNILRPPAAARSGGSCHWQLAASVQRNSCAVPCAFVVFGPHRSSSIGVSQAASFRAALIRKRALGSCPWRWLARVSTPLRTPAPSTTSDFSVGFGPIDRMFGRRNDALAPRHELAIISYWQPSGALPCSWPQTHWGCGRMSGEGTYQTVPTHLRTTVSWSVGVSVGYMCRNVPSVSRNPTGISLLYDGGGVQIGVETPFVLPNRKPKRQFTHQSGIRACRARGPRRAGCGRSMPGRMAPRANKRPLPSGARQ